ncbi:PspC domain-containing protein [Flavobacterium sp. H122]|uniref:PspC domain-containing protein n=1 Tax=Flavobacterium sp. H122 TaxID=2529860 RepID=UPI0010AA387A|nr:PspC domain-containing protein [Flavobacterium sp. H122]
MNKTVNMNLGGFFFHIDEDAYQKLNRYFDAIRNSLSAEGRDEIMNDIESRVSELFSEKLANSKQVLSLNDVDDVIAIMGQPEDYKIEDDGTSNANYAYGAGGKTKKLYRDKETGVIAGVCSGLGHYFGVDPVWIRIALVLLVFAGFGTGLLAYFILWIVTPEAVTTSEKLEMKGEPITISNIEKKVKEEFESVSDKFKSADYTQMGENVKTGAQRVGSTLGDIIVSIMKVFAKFIGAMMVLVSGVTLIGLLISLFSMGTSINMDTPWNKFFNAFDYTNTSMWLIGLLFLLAIGIPFFFLLLLGLKILVNNLKSIGNVTKYTLLALWVIAVGILISLGIRQASEIAFENKVVSKKTIDLKSTDTLEIKFKNNNYFSKNDYSHDEFEFVQDSLGRDVIYSNNISLEVLPTDEKLPFIQIEKESNGKSFADARQRAEKIEYKFKVEGNKIIFDNYFLTDIKNKFRGQEVMIYLYLPKGTYFKPDESLEHFDCSDNDFFNLHYSSDDYVYKVENKQVKCLNCPPDENDEDENYQSNIIINEDGVKIENDTVISDSKEIKELKINEDGIIIKTK